MVGGYVVGDGFLHPRDNGLSLYGLPNEGTRVPVEIQSEAEREERYEQTKAAHRPRDRKRHGLAHPDLLTHPTSCPHVYHCRVYWPARARQRRRRSSGRCGCIAGLVARAKGRGPRGMRPDADGPRSSWRAPCPQQRIAGQSSDAPILSSPRIRAAYDDSDHGQDGRATIGGRESRPLRCARCAPLVRGRLALVNPIRRAILHDIAGAALRPCRSAKIGGVSCCEPDGLRLCARA